MKLFRFRKKARKGFTLVELLLVIAILAILAGILSNAINIPVIFINSEDSRRSSDRKEVENALYQHLIDEWELLNNQRIPEGDEGDAKEICAYGVTGDANCVNLDDLVDKNYIPSLPVDPSETNPNYTGYSVYKKAGRPQVVASHLGESATNKKTTDGSFRLTLKIGDGTTNGPVGLGSWGNYGFAVEGLGDLDEDGVPDLVASTSDGDTFFHYMNADGSIKSTVKIDVATATSGAADASDWYGSDIANMGDLDGDGVTDIAVGAGKDEAGATLNAGTVWVHYLNADGSIKNSVRIGEGTTNGPTGLEAGDGYGYAVANIGDLDKDGVQDLAVGALWDDEGADADVGCFYIHFMNTNGSIKSTVKIDRNTTNGPTSLIASDGYGVSVASMGDLDGDGVQDLVVGSDHDIGASNSAGSVFVHFMNTDGSIKSTVMIGEGTSNGPTGVGAADIYGTAVENVGDLNNDGVNDLMVGAYQDEFGGDNDTGAVYLHYMNANGSVKKTVALGSGSANGPVGLDSWDFYGNAIANVGDLDGDGIPEIAVGASSDETSGSSAEGAVHLHFFVAK